MGTVEIALTIIAIIFVALTVIFGVGWKKAVKFRKEATELHDAIKQALKDGKIQKEEIGKIAEEAYDVIDMLRKIIQEIKKR